MEDKVEILDEKNDEVVKTTKKKSPVGLIILVIILMCGCLVGGYFINESGVLSSKKETKEEEKEDKKDEKEPVVTNYAVTDAKVAKLIDKLMVGTLDLEFRCNTLEAYANNKKVEAKDISVLRAYRIAENDFFNSGKQSISLEEFTATVQKYLGKDYVFNPEDKLGLGKCMTYYYDASSKTFNMQETACGGTCGPTSSYKIVRAVDTDGVLELDTKVIFASLDEGKDGYYSDYQKTNKIGTFEDNRDSLYDKGSDYKFTFKLEDGNYVFVSSEPVK